MGRKTTDRRAPCRKFLDHAATYTERCGGEDERMESPHPVDRSAVLTPWNFCASFASFSSSLCPKCLARRRGVESERIATTVGVYELVRLTEHCMEVDVATALY